jgi:hypothetical protein
MLRVNEAAFTQAIMQHALSKWRFENAEKNLNEIAWPSQGNLSEGEGSVQLTSFF